MRLGGLSSYPRLAHPHAHIKGHAAAALQHGSLRWACPQPAKKYVRTRQHGNRKTVVMYKNMSLSTTHVLCSGKLEPPRAVELYYLFLNWGFVCNVFCFLGSEAASLGLQQQVGLQKQTGPATVWACNSSSCLAGFMQQVWACNSSSCLAGFM